MRLWLWLWLFQGCQGDRSGVFHFMLLAVFHPAAALRPRSLINNLFLPEGRMQVGRLLFVTLFSLSGSPSLSEPQAPAGHGPLPEGARLGDNSRAGPSPRSPVWLVSPPLDHTVTKYPSCCFTLNHNESGGLRKRRRSGGVGSECVHLKNNHNGSRQRSSHLGPYMQSLM